MSAAARTYLTTGLALMGAGLVSAAQLTPPLQQAETRVVQAAVSLAATVATGQACSGYNTDGCDIWAKQTYTPVALDSSGSLANIAANIVNAVISIPRAYVDALNELAYSLEVTGNWWVYTPTNVLGADPADPPKASAFADLTIPIKAISQPIGEALGWWFKANFPMDAGCTATAAPNCQDLNSLLSKMFLQPIWNMVGVGYQFPTVIDPVSDEEGAVGEEIPDSEGRETAWSQAYVKLSPFDLPYSVLNYLTADPSTNTPKAVTGAEIMATLDRLIKAFVLDFYPFVPGSYLLKGWPYTLVTPLFTPFLPWLCPTCEPENPGAIPTADSAATTRVSAAAATAEPATPADPEPTTPVAASVSTGAPEETGQAGEPVTGEKKATPVNDTVADTASATGADATSTTEPATTPAAVEPSAPATEEPSVSVTTDQTVDAGSAAADAPSEAVNTVRRGQQRATRGAGDPTDNGGSTSQARTRGAASSK